MNRNISITLRAIPFKDSRGQIDRTVSQYQIDLIQGAVTVQDRKGCLRRVGEILDETTAEWFAGNYKVRTLMEKSGK